jgi:hypothetical protein
VEIFFSYNIVAAALVGVAALIIFGAGAGITSDLVKDDRKKKEKEEDDTPLDEAGYWRSYRRVTTVLFSFVLAFAAWCIHDNYAERAVAGVYEPAVIELAEAIDLAAKRPFDQRCQFNGHAVSGDWIASDSFPCADFGGFRLWKNSQVVVSKYNVGDGSKIFVGKPEGADITKVATYNPAEWGPSGIYNDRLPALNAGRDPQLIRDLASAIHNSLR